MTVNLFFKQLSTFGLAAFALTACRTEPSHTAETTASGPRASAAGSASAAPSASANAPDATPVDSAPKPESSFVSLTTLNLEFFEMDGTLGGLGLVHTVETEDEVSREGTLSYYVLRGRAFEKVGSEAYDGLFGPMVGFMYGAENGPVDVLSWSNGARTSFPRLTTFGASTTPKTKEAGLSLDGMWIGVGNRASAVIGMLKNRFTSATQQIRGPALAIRQQLPPASDPDRCGWSNQLSIVNADFFGSSSEGDFFAAGSDCADPKKPLLEIWKGDSTTSEIRALPEGKRFVLWGGQASLVSEDSLELWNGTDFVKLASAPKERTIGVAKLPSGRVFALTWVKTQEPKYEGEDPIGVTRLHELTKVGWARLSLAADPEGNRTGFRFDGKRLFAEHFKEEGTELFGLVEPGQPAPEALTINDVPPRSRSKTGKPSYQFGGPGCKHNVVVLFQFSKVTPDDYTFPLTRKALKGHTEFDKVRFAVTRDGSYKFFVGFTDSYKTATDLAALVKKGVEGSSPQVVCAKPEVLRELRLDLKTGEVVP
ncbi:MAG: hypothetical protein U0271_14850 [Polyangiaceae bacterium]